MTNLTKSLILIALAFTGCGHKAHRTVADFAKTSAMITLDSKKSGGSGVIVRSTANSSIILTNKHVCGLIQGGGLVTTDQGAYPVHSFRVYTRHDLCLIEVLADLHENNVLAEQPPKSYTTAVVAGHPVLLPTVVTIGHFVNHMSIQLMMGTKTCDGTETGQEQEMCLFTGMKPIVVSFEAQPITATIMPGSSGSGVFNEKGEISGLVFAGQQGLSYGFIVPYEYVRDFLTHLKAYPVQYPNPKLSGRDLFANLFKLKGYCEDDRRSTCKGIATIGIYSDGL